jgi:alpha-L-fucosidase 2
VGGCWLRPCPFAATPTEWTDASFNDLGAEGGHRVSARRRGGRTVWLKVVAGGTGLVRLRDTFAGRTPRWSRPGVTRAGADYVIQMAKGEALEATME